MARKAIPAAALVAIAGLTAGAEAPPGPGLLGAEAARAAAAFDRLAVAVADETGALRWALWAEGEPEKDRFVRLALIGVHDGVGAAVWSTAWAEGYSPALRVMWGWRYADGPVLAVTMQFGAAAEQVDLFGLDRAGHAVKLAEKLGALVDWTVGASQRPMLVVYQTPVVALVPTCYAWQEKRSTLAAARCPR